MDNSHIFDFNLVQYSQYNINYKIKRKELNVEQILLKIGDNYPIRKSMKESLYRNNNKSPHTNVINNIIDLKDYKNYKKKQLEALAYHSNYKEKTEINKYDY